MKNFLTTLVAIALCADALLASEPNTLTPEEKEAGWKLLFDGKSTAGWRAMEKDEFPNTGWLVEDGALFRKGSGGDIVTVEKFDDFDLQFEWKISSAGNSGLKYFIKEKRDGGIGSIGHEYQCIDDGKAADGKRPTHLTASLYDVIVPKNNHPKPQGEWNSSRVLVKGNHVEHWLNGEKTVEYELGSDELKTLVAASKFKSSPYYVDKIKTPILLQDHGNEVWFRSIKILADSAK